MRCWEDDTYHHFYQWRRMQRCTYSTKSQNFQWTNRFCKGFTSHLWFFSSEEFCSIKKSWVTYHIITFGLSGIIFGRALPSRFFLDPWCIRIVIAVQFLYFFWNYDDEYSVFPFQTNALMVSSWRSLDSVICVVKATTGRRAFTKPVSLAKKESLPKALALLAPTIAIHVKTEMRLMQIDLLESEKYVLAKCAAGSFLVTSAKQCQQCPRGTYQDESLQTSCKPCPADHTTPGPGAVKPSQCYSTNQCDTGEHDCSWHATCVDLPDEDLDKASFQCKCKPGFRGNGTFCEGTLL